MGEAGLEPAASTSWADPKFGQRVVWMWENPILNLDVSFGDGLYDPFMVISGMVYFWVYRITLPVSIDSCGR